MLPKCKVNHNGVYFKATLSEVRADGSVELNAAKGKLNHVDVDLTQH